MHVTSNMLHKNSDAYEKIEVMIEEEDMMEMMRSLTVPMKAE